MDRDRLPRPLRPFVNDDGRLSQRPSRHKTQRMAAAWMATRFALGQNYTEKEVNAVIMNGHTFADWALIRRALCDWRFLDREGNGSRYGLREQATRLIADELEPAGSSDKCSDPDRM